MLAFHRPFTLCDSVTKVGCRFLLCLGFLGLRCGGARHQSPCGLLAGWTVCVKLLISAGLSHTSRMNVAALSLHPSASVFDNENQFKRVDSGFCLRYTVLPMPQAGHPTHKGSVPE